MKKTCHGLEDQGYGIIIGRNEIREGDSPLYPVPGPASDLGSVDLELKEKILSRPGWYPPRHYAKGMRLQLATHAIIGQQGWYCK